jgi:hypothetical protein
LYLARCVIRVAGTAVVSRSDRAGKQ